MVVGPPGKVTLRGAITYRGAQPPTPAWQHGATGLSLQSVCPSPDSGCGYDYTLAVPAAVSVTASNSAGNISVSGLSGPVQIAAGAGNISLAGLSGSLKVNDGGGNITATDLRAAIADITEGAGNVVLNFKARPAGLSVRDSTGNISAIVPGSAFYHVVASDRLGTTSEGIPDDPSSQREISLAVGTGNLSLS